MPSAFTARHAAQVATLSLAVATLAVVPQALPPPSVISIVGTNDVHGGVLERDGRGGLALLGGYLDNLRAARRRGGIVLPIDAGDMFQGTLESNLNEGEVVVEAYRRLGYAAVAIGNHEFDFGPVGPDQFVKKPGDDPRGALRARAAQAPFPFLAANLIDEATGDPVAWVNVQPSAILHVRGVQIAVIGVMTRAALSQTLAANVKGLRVAPLTDTIVRYASEARTTGATVVIVTAHAGGRCTAFDRPTDASSCDDRGEIIAVARQLPAGLVDAIVAGHTHAAIAHEVAGIPIVESYSAGRTFGRVDLTLDPATRRVKGHRIYPPQDLCAMVDPGSSTCGPGGDATRRVPATYEGRRVVRDARIASVLAPAVARAAELKAMSLSLTLDTPIRRGGRPESPLGNLFVDAMLEATSGATVAINNTFGGLRTDLPAGPLTYGKLFEVFPFDNRLVTIDLTGRQLREVVAGQLRQRLPAGIGGFHVEARCAGGSADVTLRRPSGTAIADDERLVVATTDFLATGGDGVFTRVMPSDGFTLPDASPLARDEVAAVLRARGGHVGERDLTGGPARWRVDGGLPLACGQ